LKYTYQHESHSPEETKNLAATLKAYLAPGAVLALIGDLGSGKTTFVQGLVAAYGVSDPVVSPTFTYIREYETPEAMIVHIDAYRLENPADLFSLGYSDYLQQKAVLLIEWADKVLAALPEETSQIHLHHGNDEPNIRKLTFELPFEVPEWQ